MNVSLAPELERFLNEQVRSGRYSSPEEAVSKAVELLKETEEAESRHFTFWLMAIYVGCCLGLLLTTSFLGLRRYLKQRKLQIPASMASLNSGSGDWPHL